MKSRVFPEGMPMAQLDGMTTNQRFDYLHNNPVEAEIVDEPAHYLYSARDFAGKKGLLKVEFIC